MNSFDYLSHCTGFAWDKGNVEKNWRKHKVTPSECEQIFFNPPLIIADDIDHSQEENRHYALGKTNTERLLFVVFTIRNDLIRIISARNMHKKERRAYNNHEKE